MTNPELLTVMMSIETVIENSEDKAKAADAVLKLVKNIIAETRKPKK